MTVPSVVGVAADVTGIPVTVAPVKSTVPVNVGDSRGALRPRAVVIVAAYDASSLIAAASSLSVFNAPGAESTIAAAAFDAAVSA